MTRKKTRRKATRPPSMPVDWTEAKRLYVDHGLSYSEISRRLGWSPSGIRGALLAHGVRSRRRKKRPPRQWSKKLEGVWYLMRRKCRDRTYASYKHYGARGIDFCPEWERFEPFYRWALKSGYRPGKPLVIRERARVFSPATCRWAPAEDRVRLRLRVNPPSPRRLVTAFGETKGLMAWAKDPRCSVRRETLRVRLDRGYAPEDAISLPADVTRSARDRRRIRRRRGRKPATRKANVIDWENAERLHRRGISAPKIAQALGVSYSAVLAGLKRKGLYVPRSARRAGSKYAAPLHRIWHRLRQISTRRNRYDEEYYGARASRVASEWRTFTPFYRWAIENGYRRGLELARRDRKLGFSPANCRWITKEQAARFGDEPPPTPFRGRMVRAFGTWKSLAAWERDSRCVVTAASLSKRLRSGMDPEEAITKPSSRTGGGPRARVLTAFGVTKSLTSWTRDRRCRVTRAATIIARLDRGMTPESAITSPSRKSYMSELSEKSRRRRTRSRK